jgi:hypothetical protein
MSDTIDDFRALHDHRKALRAKFGVPCPECKKRRPRAFPSILLPGGWCKIHQFRDPRPELTDADHKSVEIS